MTTAKGNVSKFNSHVNSIAEEMNARSHTNSDPLLALFAACKNAPDESFQCHIEGEENNCDDGATITVVQLMKMAL